jgi:type III restriction enzyme
MPWVYFFNQISNFLKGSEGSVSNNYLFNELFYDSELEKKNITTNLREVVVFTKIPKNALGVFL